MTVSDSDFLTTDQCSLPPALFVLMDLLERRDSGRKRGTSTSDQSSRSSSTVVVSRLLSTIPN